MSFVVGMTWICQISNRWLMPGISNVLWYDMFQWETGVEFAVVVYVCDRCMTGSRERSATFGRYSVHCTQFCGMASTSGKSLACISWWLPTKSKESTAKQFCLFTQTRYLSSTNGNCDSSVVYWQQSVGAVEAVLTVGIRTALCWIVWHNVHSPQHTYMSRSYRSNIKIVPEMTYYVSSGTVNPTHSLTH